MLITLHVVHFPYLLGLMKLIKMQGCISAVLIAQQKLKFGIYLHVFYNFMGVCSSFYNRQM